MLIKTASNTSAMTMPSPTGSLQMALYAFRNPTSICSTLGDRRGTSIDIFVGGVGVGLIHTKNLILKKLKSAREIGELETEGENAKKTPFGRVFESYFDLPNHYSNIIVITDSDFILTERTCAIAITADVSFKTALAADFKREYKNIEFLWKQAWCGRDDSAAPCCITYTREIFVFPGY